MAPIYSKAKGGTLGAAVAGALIAVGAYFGIDLPEALDGAITVILTYAGAWFVPERIVEDILARLRQALVDGEISGSLAEELTEKLTEKDPRV